MAGYAILGKPTPDSSVCAVGYDSGSEELPSAVGNGYTMLQTPIVVARIPLIDPRNLSTDFTKRPKKNSEFDKYIAPTKGTPAKQKSVRLL